MEKDAAGCRALNRNYYCRRYDYEMTGIVYPPYADKNILIDYGIIEESELEK